ncbi:ada2a-containing complex component 1 [Arctopsyche grandis]|uniref:ada2a-containing complex component 1 n=1 Tax=Arctopsyche grandis TaxID=121162 RepID=UPI00406D86E0
MEEDESREFYFESDHLALRNNDDYRSMLKYIVSLESQKLMVIKDIETLYTSQRNALEDPLKFLDDLKSGNVDLPQTYTIPELPSINWSQYGMSQQIPNSTKEKMSDSESENSNIFIRGRPFNQTKPQTFNQLWTCEEQKRLEELLKEFPEEEVDMRRWAKIANALGNRTPKQVMSRVQKYFIKLQRAGLPVPGRVRFSKTNHNNRNPRNNKVLQKKSTFFPHQNVPVLMDESQFDSNVKMEYGETKEWTQLELMNAVYERRKIEEMSDQPLSVHKGISCISCKSLDIVGTRWVDGVGGDWCSDCLVEYQPTTRMIPVTSNDTDI